MHSVVEQINQNLYELLTYFWDPNKRLYFGYLLGAALLAYWVYRKQPKTSTQASFSHFLFPKKVWLSRSAKQDYVLLILNKLIRAFFIVPILITMVPIAIGFSNALEAVFGQIPPVTQSKNIVIICFTALLFIFDDFTRFLLHWLLHKVPVLWCFHQVHHSATQLTPFTVFRSHPIENMLYAQRMAFTQGVTVGLCYYLFGPTLQMFDILGANLCVFIFNVFGSNLRHSHIWLSWGRCEKLFISPAQHQLHHSDHVDHIDCNLGTALSIWDRIFKTWIPSSKAKPHALNFGVKASPNLHSSLLKIYYQPFLHAFNKVFAKRR